ncbi:RNA polymerase sigma factor [Goodfellowiella coeruleoviolacea]|uniref:RNA polymerase sigma factor, sigma-70 family n=1 Tax=Goodfellowiella coeruleoviolacea TaxID=334858 RepID=A0AAE3GAT7_9PSEU|nr:sigma-70 family RNA polymerase sigma factor [Goodfellowiella coeruleoviolacea]MCP2164867.1 RNA polymerase sigma factor, sigma-70 family [Goodfellowiella coeruleoviolacea]
MSELRTTETSPPWEGLEGTDRHAACLVAARAGDRQALNILVAELSPVVWHVARGNGLDRPTAEDVVQTVWLALLRHLDRLQEPRALVGWLVVTTRHEAQRSWRANRNQVPLSAELAEQLPTESWLPEDEAVRVDRDKRLWAAFSRLTHRCQELLRLTVFNGRADYRAVAESLAMPRGSIGPTRGRCLDSLRAQLDSEGGSR